ncbi:MAG: DnaJ domain-containing protein [Solibacillus isronensis]
MSLIEKLDSLKGLTEHEILGVPYTATADELKKARRSLLKEYHPDRQSNPEEREAAEDLSALVNQSYQLIIEGKATQPSLPEDKLEVKGLTLAAAVGLSANDLIKGATVSVEPFGQEGKGLQREIEIPPLTVADSCIVYGGLGDSMDGGSTGNLIVQCLAVSKKFDKDDLAVMGSERIVSLDYSSESAIGDNTFKLFNGKKINAVKASTSPHLLLIKDVANRGLDKKSALIHY